MLRIVFFSISAVLLAGCASSTQLGLSKQEWRAMPQKQRKQVLADYQQIKQQEPSDKVYAGPKLSIYMLNGEAMMPPFTQRYAFQTFEFRMSPGRCRWVTLKSIDTHHKVNMRVCYNGLELSIDPSRYDLASAKGSIFFDYNPIWKRGFTYSDINTQGYARLKDASITVKAIPNTSPKDA